MRIAAVIIVALLAGLMLGSWGPRSDLRKARERIVELEKNARTQGSGPGTVSGITGMLRIPVKESGAARRPARLATPPATNAAPATPFRPARGRMPGEGRRNQFRENLQAATDAWRMRSDLARNSFASNVATTGQQVASFDVLMAAMNLRLSNSISRWAEAVGTNGLAMTPETGIRMVSDLSSIIVVAYDDLDRAMEPGWRELTDRKFQLFDFIDPAVALPLAEIEMAPEMREDGSPDPEDRIQEPE